MNALVDYSFYQAVFMGREADEVSFPALCARAADVVGAMARWQVTADNIDSYPAHVRTLYRKAICAQVDYFAVNGLDSVAGGSDRGFTVGKVSVSGKNGGELVKNGAIAEYIAPMAQMYLEQTGLLNPAMPVSALLTESGWWL